MLPREATAGVARLLSTSTVRLAVAWCDLPGLRVLMPTLKRDQPAQKAGIPHSVSAILTWPEGHRVACVVEVGHA